MTDITGIANIALVELGAKPVTEIGDGSANADILKSNFDQVLDAVLRSHPWNSVMARKRVTVDQKQPDFGYRYRYALPTDPYCLRVWKVNGNDQDWKVEGRWIVTNISGSLAVEYISRPITVEDLDPMLVHVVALTLAARCAYRITNSRTKEERAAQKAKGVLRDARSADGQEGMADILPESDIVLSRFGP